MPFQLESDGARQFLLLAEKGLQINRERKLAMASALRHSACSWAMSASLILSSPWLIRFTSVLGEYFDLFQHIILFWKMGTTTGQRSQADNQFWGCSLSKLTDPQEYQFGSAACKHCLSTSRSVLLIVFIQKKPQTSKPPVLLPTGPTLIYLATLDLLEAKEEGPPLRSIDSEPLRALSKSWLACITKPKVQHEWSGSVGILHQ